MVQEPYTLHRRLAVPVVARSRSVIARFVPITFSAAASSDAFCLGLATDEYFRLPFTAAYSAAFAGSIQAISVSDINYFVRDR